MIKNKRGWIKIIEAFVAIMLITGVLLIVINREYIERRDISEKVYAVELSILREVQSNTTLRKSILETETEDLPVKLNDGVFPLNVKNKIFNRLPNYLNCTARICEMSDFCMLDDISADKNIYAQSIAITLIVGEEKEFDPRQLKLFCWTGTPSEEEPSEEPPKEEPPEEEPGVCEPECVIGGSCDTGLFGICSAGIIRSCTETCTIGICEEQISPEIEICDNEDNDCDSLVNEDINPIPCYNGPDGTEGVGICIGGTQSCTTGGWGACIGEQLPEEEGFEYHNCRDLEDNDCDGKTDTDNECF
jgi:hypothetical protein